MASIFLKQPAEDFTIAVEYSGDLDTGETISNKTVTATDLTDNSDATATVISASSISGTQVLVRVQAGSTNHDYLIHVRATTSTTQDYEHDVTMQVREGTT